MQIGGIQKTSLLDYPDKISAIVFTQGCNFRCGYCHNPELLVMKNIASLSQDEIFEFLKTRIGKLDAVVITGGEPCLQQDLLEFIKAIKDLGLLVKLDTNGSYPQVLHKVLPYVDYVAMDIKAPLGKYSHVTKVNINTQNIEKSINLIMKSGIDYEFRTTVLKNQLNFDDFDEIGKMINGAKKYYLQKFVPTKILDAKLINEKTYADTEFEHIIRILGKYVEQVMLR